jgi:transposase
MRPAGKPDQLQKRRHQAIELLKKGERPVDVARKLGVNRRTVRFWNAAYRKNGLQGLKAKPNLGRPAKLSAARKKQLERSLLQGPEAHGFSTPLWTCPRVREVVKRQFGVVYHVDHIWHLLRFLGWSPQKPERQARERDERAIRRWVKTDWPLLRKKRSA